MNEIEVEGKTVEDAIKDGLKNLACSRDQVDVKILYEGTIRALRSHGHQAGPGPPDAQGAGRLLRRAGPLRADVATAQARAKDITLRAAQLMGFSFTEINTAYMTGRILMDIKSTDSTLIIGKNGQTLTALEHILNLILHRDENTRVKVSLDTESYRRHQEERLQDIAVKAAATVKETGTVHRFEPMNSASAASSTWRSRTTRHRNHLRRRRRVPQSRHQAENPAD